MARFFGEVGYGESVEDPSESGIWVDHVVEMEYQGDVIRDISQIKPGNSENSDISVSNAISIVADDFAVQNFLKIKYVKWAGTPWAVSSVEVRSPRLILTLGGVYNGPTS